MSNDPDASRFAGVKRNRAGSTYCSVIFTAGTAVRWRLGNSDRVEAVSLKAATPVLNKCRPTEKYAIAASFHLHPPVAGDVLMSAHADAFKAARRRVFTGEVVGLGGAIVPADR